MNLASAQSTRWTHRPGDGSVAWGVATLVVPAVPLLCLVPLVLISAVAPDSSGQLRSVLSPVPWIVLGGLLVARTSSSRRVRGAGLGLLTGSLTTVLVGAVVSGGWTP